MGEGSAALKPWLDTLVEDIVFYKRNCCEDVVMKVEEESIEKVLAGDMYWGWPCIVTSAGGGGG